MLAMWLRDMLADNQVSEPWTVVCVEPDAWTERPDATGPNVHHDVAKIVVTFHDVSDVEWLTHLLAQRQAQGGR
jgi:hypothetical protein